jgi:hypothetical protein
MTIWMGLGTRDLRGFGRGEGGAADEDIRDKEMESLLRRDSGMLALSKDHPRSGDSVPGCGGLLLRGGSDARGRSAALRLAASFGAATSSVAELMTCSASEAGRKPR